MTNVNNLKNFADGMGYENYAAAREWARGEFGFMASPDTWVMENGSVVVRLLVNRVSGHASLVEYRRQVAA